MDSAHSLTSRIERLETQTRRWRTAGLAAGTLALGLLASAMVTPADKVVEAEAFRLVDSAGVARASLWVDGEKAGLSLNDPTGRERVQLLATDLESILTFLDENGTDRTVLTSGHNDHGLYLLDGGGHDRVALMGLDSEQSLVFHDPRGVSRVGLVVSDDDHGLYLMNREGSDQLSLITTERDEGLFFSGDRGLFVVDGKGGGSLQLVTQD